MKPFTLSRKIKHGSACVLKMGKLIRAGKRNKNILGIWQGDFIQRGFHEDGSKFTFSMPPRLVTYGNADAKMGEERK